MFCVLWFMVYAFGLGVWVYVLGFAVSGLLCMFYGVCFRVAGVWLMV